ncbi:GPI mannosyltransferase 2, putative [Plasmodium ovale]|uniref:GPI mannosyltransferase 2 n=1 Tax=Plasmodium ovale TaxID=36330 RepID=A0A1D3UAX1_PLAOA|nr:GPI mannosyltransferase 2, putative [Plasmodium ovale]
MLSRPKVEIRQKLKVNRTSGILITVAVAILVRVFCVIYTIVWSRLVNNYKFSNDILCGINGSATIGADRNGEVGTLWEYVRCFSQWDGEYFLRLSLNETEYLYEQNHAFFPSLPLIIIFTKKLLPKVMQNADTCLLNVILAVIINNFFFILATVGVYLFPFIYFKERQNLENGHVLCTMNEENCFYLHHFKDKEECNRFSFFLSIIYSFSIGNVHVISFYNESIFSCFSIWGFNFLQLSLNSHKKKYIFEILSILSFFIASLFRSNGILFLIPLFFFNVHSCTFFQHCYSVLLHNDGKEKHKKKIDIFSYFSSKKGVLFFVLHWLKALIEAIIVLSPFLIYQLYAYHLYCMDYDDEWKEENKKFYSFLSNFVKSPYFYLDIKKYRNYENKTLLRSTSWCSKTLPFVYNYIQHKYWNVKFLKFLTEPRVNIVYAAPVYFISFHSVVMFFTRNYFIPSKMLMIFNPLFGNITHLCVFTLYLLLFAHNEIILRLIISSPMFYLHYAYLLKYFEKWNWLFLANLLYFFVGPPLFGTYIAWT